MKRSRMRQIQSIILGRVKIFRQVGSPRSSDSRIILSVQSTEAHFTQFSRIFRQIYMKTPKTIKGHLKSIVLCLNYFSINQKNNSSSSSLEALPCSSLEYLLSLFSLDGKHTLLSYTLTWNGRSANVFNLHLVPLQSCIMWQSVWLAGNIPKLEVLRSVLATHGQRTMRSYQMKPSVPATFTNNVTRVIISGISALIVLLYVLSQFKLLWWLLCSMA